MAPLLNTRHCRTLSTKLRVQFNNRTERVPLQLSGAFDAMQCMIVSTPHLVLVEYEGVERFIPPLVALLQSDLLHERGEVMAKVRKDQLKHLSPSTTYFQESGFSGIMDR